MPRRVALSFVLALAAVASLAADLRPAHALPVFARRYGVGCRRCHAPFPRLNQHGALFAAHGFRESDDEAPFDTASTPDPLLALGRTLPLSIRMDGNLQAFGGRHEAVRTDLQTPWNLKILSSAPLSKSLSYYFYFFFFEQGEVGVEDAYVHWNRVGGTRLDVLAGQFQVSDPLFKRELRLPLEDYTVYRAHVGDVTTDLTYDRGLMASLEHGPLAASAQVVNGNGKVTVEDSPVMDDDSPKNVAARLSLEAVPGVRVGGFGYTGRQDGGSGPDVVRAELWYAGVDATLSAGSFELNAQWLRRRDRRPTFTPGEPDATTDGGFVEALWTPETSRAYAFALWNRVDCDRAILNPRAGGPEAVTRFQTLTGGGGWQVQRNVRAQGELTWDTERERWKTTASMVFAY